MGFTISIKGTPELCHSKINGPRKSSRIQAPSSSLLHLSSVLASSFLCVFSYNYKVAEVVIEVHQSATLSGSSKGDISDMKFMRKENFQKSSSRHLLTSH